jgi:hypothetical protein
VFISVTTVPARITLVTAPASSPSNISSRAGCDRPAKYRWDALLLDA